MSDTIEMLYFLFGLGVGFGMYQDTEGNSMEKYWSALVGIFLWPIVIGYGTVRLLRKKFIE